MDQPNQDTNIPHQTETYESQYSGGDFLKQQIVITFFEVVRLGYGKQVYISDSSYESSFTSGVRLITAGMWKYVPLKIRILIRDAYSQLAKETAEIQKGEGNDPTKRLRKQELSYDTAVAVIRLLFHCLNNSPLAVEFKEMKIDDFKTLVETIRTKKKIDVFQDSEIDVE